MSDVKRKGFMSVASLVLGLVGTAITVFSYGTLGWIGTILGILGIIFGAIGKKSGFRVKAANIGLFFCVALLVLGTLMLYSCDAMRTAYLAGLN